MPLQFDLESDKTFFRTLEDLGSDIADFVIVDLLTKAVNLSWANFVTAYKWREHERVPIDTYPGPNIYYCFDVQLKQGLLTKSGASTVVIYAIYFGDELVLCAVAQ